VGDGHGAVVVYPEGLARSWNAGDCCDQAAKAGVDDADFVRGVVADLAARVPLDRRRVMLVGYSNGGMLAYQIACRTPQQLAGLVLVNASRQGRSCEPRTPVSIVAVHSRGDRTLPFAGQRYSRLLKVATRGVMASLDPFVADDACAEVRLTPQEIWESRTYRSCRSGSEVTLLVHPTLDHRWPTGLPGGSTVGALAWERLGARVAVEDFAGGRIPLQDPPAG
jgi:poly(3-hydroxybutyrate) depolymerase